MALKLSSIPKKKTKISRRFDENKLALDVEDDAMTFWRRHKEEEEEEIDVDYLGSEVSKWLVKMCLKEIGKYSLLKHTNQFSRKF